MEAIDEALARWSKLQEARAQCEPMWFEVEEKQSQSLAARKRLAEDTKAFKKLPDDERMGRWPDLLKAYQLEIDALSKRAKLSESAFSELLTVSKAVPEAAVVRKLVQGQLAAKSPVKGSAQLEEQLRQKEAQVARLTSEFRDVEAELRGVKNQEVAVRRLQKQVKDLEAEAEEKILEAMEERDAEWKKRLDEMRQESDVQRQSQLETIAQLADQRELGQDELDRMRQQHLEELRLAEQAVLARAAEVETLSSDLERAQAELERERALRREASSAGGGEAQGSVKVLQSLLDGVQQRAAGLEREAADLRRQLSEAESHSNRLQEKHHVEVARLTAQCANREASLLKVQEELACRPSFDDVNLLRQQVANIETVQLANVDAATSDLERRSLQRQRLLQEQLDEASIQSDGYEKEIDTLRAKLHAQEDACSDLRNLVQRLETELSAGSAARTQSTNIEPSLAALMHAKDSAGGFEAGCSTGGAGSETMPSMLDIVTGQRDRLRARIGELEQERDRWRHAADQERKRAETLHGDNVKLVERTRYLQSYQPKQGAGGRRPPRGKLDQDLEGRYQASEDGLGPSPFEQFQKDEKARKIASMNPGERVLVTLSTIMMASRPARVITLAYMSALHLLVFLVLMRLAHNAHKSC